MCSKKKNYFSQEAINSFEQIHDEWEFCNSKVKEREISENSSSEDDEVSNDNEPESQRAHETEHNSSTQHHKESIPDTNVTAEATDVACSIVKSCLAQI